MIVMIAGIWHILKLKSQAAFEKYVIMLRFGGNSENSVHSDYMAYNDYFHVLFSLFPPQITLRWMVC